MEWVWIALAAYLLHAVVFVVDSLLVTRHLKNATAYAFFVAMLGLLAFLLIPFTSFEFLDQKTLITAFLGGGAFTFGTLFLYRAFAVHEATRVVPVVGGTVPIFSFLLSYFFLPERLTARQMLAFLLLIAGTILVTYPLHRNTKHHMKPAIIGEMLLAGLLFACWGTLAKRVFFETDFINGIIWIRLGAALAGLLLLFGPKLRNDIFRSKTHIKRRAGALVLGNKSLGAFSGLLVNYALSRGSAPLVHALEGIQFVFVFGIVLLLSHWFPRVLKEDLRAGLVLQKLGSSVLFAIGIALLII